MAAPGFVSAASTLDQRLDALPAPLRAKYRALEDDAEALGEQALAAVNRWHDAHQHAATPPPRPAGPARPPTPGTNAGPTPSPPAPRPSARAGRIPPPRTPPSRRQRSTSPAARSARPSALPRGTPPSRRAATPSSC